MDEHDAGGPAGPDVEQVMWQLAVDAAGIGAFDWDLRTGALRWDDRLLTVFGLTREQFGGTIEAISEGPGKGAEFTITLPASVLHAQPAQT